MQASAPTNWVYRPANPQHAPCPKIPVEICQKNRKTPLTKVWPLAIIIRLSRGGGRGKPFHQQLVRVFWRKLLQKTFRKPLDKRENLIYNIQAVSESRQHSRTLKIEQNWNLWNLDRGFGNPRKSIPNFTSNSYRTQAIVSEWLQWFNAFKWRLNTIYKEFDPGSGRTLAARLTHASRTESRGACFSWFSGERVSNAWVTCPGVGDNSWKRLLIPHKPTIRHRIEGKGFIRFRMDSRPIS